MRRKDTPLHRFWHRRVDGQVKHTIGQHPEWFSFKNQEEKNILINSIAKRVVGEIVAVAAKSSDKTKENVSGCSFLWAGGDDSRLLPPGGEDDLTLSSPPESPVSEDEFCLRIDNIKFNDPQKESITKTREMYRLMQKVGFKVISCQQ